MWHLHVLVLCDLGHKMIVTFFQRAKFGLRFMMTFYSFIHHFWPLHMFIHYHFVEIKVYIIINLGPKMVVITFDI